MSNVGKMVRERPKGLWLLAAVLAAFVAVLALWSTHSGGSAAVGAPLLFGATLSKGRKSQKSRYGREVRQYTTERNKETNHEEPFVVNISNVSDLPTVPEIAERVCKNQVPCLLQRDDKALAVVIPIKPSLKRTGSIVEQTAGVFSMYARLHGRPLTAQELRRTAEEAIAEDTVKRSG